ESLAAIVKCPQRAPRWVVAADRIAKVEPVKGKAAGNKSGRVLLLNRAANRDQLVLRIGPGQGSHRRRRHAFELYVIDATVGGDDEVRTQPRREGLNQNMNALGIARAACRIADGPADGVARCYRDDCFA